MALTEVGDGGSYVWRRSHGRLSGIVQPTASFKDPGGRVCRHIVLTMTVGTATGQAPKASPAGSPTAAGSSTAEPGRPAPACPAGRSGCAAGRLALCRRPGHLPGTGSSKHAVAMGRLHGGCRRRTGAAQRHAEGADGHAGHRRRHARAFPVRAALRAPLPGHRAVGDAVADAGAEWRDDRVDRRRRAGSDRGHGPAACRHAGALLRRHHGLRQDGAGAGRRLRPGLPRRQGDARPKGSPS